MFFEGQVHFACEHTRENARRHRAGRGSWMAKLCAGPHPSSHPNPCQVAAQSAEEPSLVQRIDFYLKSHCHATPPPWTKKRVQSDPDTVSEGRPIRNRRIWNPYIICYTSGTSDDPGLPPFGILKASKSERKVKQKTHRKNMRGDIAALAKGNMRGDIAPGLPQVSRALYPTPSEPLQIRRPC